MPILNCTFSSGRHLYEILSVGVPSMGVQHARPEVILLLQCQSSPIQQSNAKFLFGIDIMLLGLHQVHLLYPSQDHNLLEMDWRLCCCICDLACSPVSISHSC